MSAESVVKSVNVLSPVETARIVTSPCFPCRDGHWPLGLYCLESVRVVFVATLRDVLWHLSRDSCVVSPALISVATALMAVKGRKPRHDYDTHVIPDLSSRSQRDMLALTLRVMLAESITNTSAINDLSDMILLLLSMFKSVHDEAAMTNDGCCCLSHTR